MKKVRLDTSISDPGCIRAGEVVAAVSQRSEIKSHLEDLSPGGNQDKLPLINVGKLSA